MLTIKNLKKQCGAEYVVKNINFAVGKNEILGLLGENGAGKTTTLQMILGLVEPTEGEIEIFGMDLKSRRTEILKKVGFAASYAALPGNLTVYENLVIFAKLFSVPEPRKRVHETLEQLRLSKFTHLKTGKLSSGEQALVAIAKSLINKPKLILLDEPTASLDPVNARLIRQIIKDYVAKNKTAVLWTSHDMREIESVCDRIILMSKGRIVLEGKPNELIKYHGEENLETLFISITEKHYAQDSMF